MTTGIIPIIPKQRFVNENGKPLSGGSVTVYLAGTTALATSFQDEALTIANQNPVILDSYGCCDLWLDPSTRYKLQLADANGRLIPGWPVDNIPGTSDVVGAAAAAAAAGVAAVAPYATAASGSATSAAGSATQAGSARDASFGLSGIYATQADGVSNGVSAITGLVAGSGGTPGQYDAIFTGGAGSGAAARIVVGAGGTVTSITLTAKGRGYTSAPAISFANATGLTGASATAVIAQNTISPALFGVLSGVAGETTIIYQATGVGTSTDTGKRIISSALLTTTTSGALVEWQDTNGLQLSGILNDGTFVSRARPRTLDAPSTMTIGGNTVARTIQEDAQATRTRQLSQWIDKGLTFGEAPFNSNTLIFSNALDGTAYPQVRFGGSVVAADGTLLCWALATDVGDFGTGSLTFKRVTYNPTTRGVSVSALSVWENGAVDPDGGSVVGRWNAPTPILHTSGPNKNRVTVIFMWMNADQTLNRIFERHTDDNGLTFSARVEKTSQFPMSNWVQLATGPAQGIQIRNGPNKGRLVLPVWHGSPGYPNANGSNVEFPYIGRAALLISDDYGPTWSVGVEAPLDQIGNFSNECGVAEDWQGDLLWEMRSPAYAAKSMIKVGGGGTKLTSDRYSMVDGDGAVVTMGQTMSGVVQGAERPKISGAPKLLISLPQMTDQTRYGGALYLSYDGGLTWPYRYQVTDTLTKFGYSQPAILDHRTYGVFYENTVDSCFLHIVNHASLT